MLNIEHFGCGSVPVWHHLLVLQGKTAVIFSEQNFVALFGINGKTVQSHRQRGTALQNIGIAERQAGNHLHERR